MGATDVVVVGAGPAGVSTAIHLTRAGREVVLLDKATFPRDKICGDGLTTGALRELEELGFEPRRVTSWEPATRIVVRSPSGVTRTFPVPEDGTYIAVAPRMELDSELVDLARKEGVDVREGHEVTGAEMDTGGVTVSSAGTAVRAHFAVAADGMWSPLRRNLGLATPGYLGEWHAFRQYASNVTGPAATALVVSFEPDLLPGYLWSFPLPHGRANVGFGIQRGEGTAVREMKRLWPDLLARPHVREALGPGAVMEGSHRAWPIPARIDAVEAGRGRILLAGDAVAACDPMTGEGIGQALLTGRLAARAINGAWGHPDTVQHRYRSMLDSELAADHRMSMLLIRALRHRKGARAAVRVAGLTPWTRRNFARWLFEDEPRGVLLTPARWHRDFLRRPGAYREG